MARPEPDSRETTEGFRAKGITEEAMRDLLAQRHIGTALRLRDIADSRNSDG